MANFKRLILNLVQDLGIQPSSPTVKGIDFFLPILQRIKDDASVIISIYVNGFSIGSLNFNVNTSINLKETQALWFSPFLLTYTPVCEMKIINFKKTNDYIFKS